MGSAKAGLVRFQGRFYESFKTKTWNVSNRAFQYLQGQILEKEAVNMTNIPKVVPGSDNQSLQHFISESSWDDESAITELQKYAVELIGDKNNASLHVDESGFPKQGKHSAGVTRQYCGRLGKVENCQVGVFLGYANGSYRTLIDKRLYLPKEWIDDAERCRRCNVPEDIEFKTKADLGLEMILKAKKRGVPFGWVGMDCFYGEQPEFLDNLNGNGIIYIADVPCNTRIWLEMPKISEGLETQPTDARDVVKQLNESQWKHIFIRDTERKELWCQIACLRVYPVRDRLPGEETWLVIRKNDGENEIKYQFSNAPPETSVERLGKMSASRYWIERALEDAKGELGMADYQVRGWWGWHHHMTMTMLAMLFLLVLLVEMKDKAPGLTIQDVREILEVILPKRKITEDEALKMLQQKLKAKESARRSHHKRNIG